ncbi:LptF/LptG family permease [bacterium]|nr:LptF/LptG family permease [bacterium]
MAVFIDQLKKVWSLTERLPRPLKTIDAYILLDLQKPFIAGTFGFVVMNLANLLYIYAKLIVDSGVPVSVVLKLLAFNLPAIMVITFPVAYLFATLLTIGRLSRDSEITALRACGTSFKRITVPIIIGSVIVSYGNFLINDQMVPWANRNVVDLVRTIMLRQSKPIFKDNVFFKGQDNRYFYVKQVDQRSNIMYSVMIFDRTGTTPVVISARQGTWSGRRWKLTDGVIHRYGQEDFVQVEEPFANYDVEVDQNPETFFTQGDLSPQEQTSAQLKKQIDTMKSGGVDTKSTEVDYYLKFSLPWTALFVTLFAAPIGLRFARLGTFIGVAITIATVFVYYIVMSIARSMGNAGMLDPITAAWVENFLFGIVGVFLLWRVDRSS